MPKIVDHDQRREQIVDALWRVVAKEGAAAVSVRSVAAEAGVSKTNIGHYFPSQGQLIGLAVEQMIDGATEKIMSLDLDNCDVDIATKAILAAIPDTAARRRQSEIWLLLLSQHDTDPTLAPVLSHLNVSVRDGITVILSALDQQGLVADDRDLKTEVGILHAIVDGLSLQTLTDPKFMPPKTIKKIVSAHLRGLA